MEGKGGSPSHKSLKIPSEHFHKTGTEDTVFIFLTKCQCMAMVHLKPHIYFGQSLKLKDKYGLPVLSIKCLVFYILKKKAHSINLPFLVHI